MAFRIPPVARSVGSRLVVGLTLALAGAAAAALHAQIPGRNVNMVAGVRLPDGDPYLQRQNEPSIAASTRNPLHLLGGSNDYRTIDIAMPDDGGQETGDAWLGLYKSTDGGQRWTTTLLPGYPQEPPHEGLDPQGRKSPLKTGHYLAAADPVVRAGTNGLFYYGGLAFDRGADGKSAIFMARFIDNNNREDRDAIAYLGTSLVAAVPAGSGLFLDKPWVAVDVPRGGNPGTCRIETPGGTSLGAGGTVVQRPPIVQTVPAGTVYMSYTLFFNDASGARRAQIYVTRSTDCGVTWQPPMQVSRTEDPLNQGSTISIDPRTGHVYVAWRRFSEQRPNAPNLDAMMVARLPAGSRRFNPPGVARRFPKGEKRGLQPERLEKEAAAREVADIAEFDQGTAAFKFRTNAYPVMTIDGDGRVYVAWSERGFATARPSPVDGDARIVITTTSDGASFTAPTPIDNAPGADTPGEELLNGHQVMPSLAFAGGRLMVIYYDLRETRARIFGPQISDEHLTVRNTIDIRAAMGTPGAVPQFAPSVKVSDYLQGFVGAQAPRQQLQYNTPNLPMFRQGTAAFMGDYIDIQPAPAFVPVTKGKRQEWVYNTAPGGSLPVFHAVWTDNRDVRAPRFDLNNDGNPWNDYTPVRVTPEGTPISIGACHPDNTGSRNQNIYTSRITGGLQVASPSNSKTLSPSLQRAFVVYAQNATRETRAYRMTILAQPPGGRASFEQFPLPPYTASSPPPRVSIDFRILPRSTVSRTVYVTSTDPTASVTVVVLEIADVGGAIVPDGHSGFVILNPDIENPEIENPEIENPEIENPEIENAEVYNPEIENPEIENPEIENPEIENPEIENPEIENIVVANPEIENPDIENPEIENPEIENPEIENTDIANVAVGGEGVLTDITWNVTNIGNTTSAFNVNLFLAQATLPGGLKAQLILHKTYRTPVARPGTCELAYQARNIIVANIPRPQFISSLTGGTFDQNDSSEKNATLWLGPGEIGKITLRVYDPSRADNVLIEKVSPDGTVRTVSVDRAVVPGEAITPVIQQQAVNTDDALAADPENPPEPPIVPHFPAPQVTPDAVSTAAETPVRLNVLANDAAAFGSMKIQSFHAPGMGQHMGSGPGKLFYMPTTGWLYVGGSRAVGVVDPGTDRLIGRIPLPAPLGVSWGLANPAAGIVYMRQTGAASGVLLALDARAGSPTFHKFLAVPALSGGVFTFALDATGSRLFVVHGTLTPMQQSISAVDANPASPTFHQVIWSVSMPAGARAWAGAVNARTGKLYLASTGPSAATSGVFALDPGAPGAPVKVPGSDGALGVVANDTMNLVYAAGIPGNSYRVNVIDGATDTVIGQVPLGVQPRLGVPEERLAVHRPTGRVFVRSLAHLFAVDGNPHSPTFRTILAQLPVGDDNGLGEVIVDESSGVAITSQNRALFTTFVDVATLAVTGVVPSLGTINDVAYDPVLHRAFTAIALSGIQEILVAPPAPPAQVGFTPVFAESAGIFVNQGRGRAYVGRTTNGSGFAILSGAGLLGDVTGLPHRAGRYTFGAHHEASNRFFVTNSASDVPGLDGLGGSLAIIDGDSDTASLRPTIALPFGAAINQATHQLYVASLAFSTGTAVVRGKIAVHDLSQPSTPFVEADTTQVPGDPSFGRHVVVNPATGRAYFMVLGGSAASLAYVEPTESPAQPIVRPVDLTSSLPADYRVEVIRVHAALNRIFLGLANGVTGAYQVLALDGTSHAVVGSFAGGGHSRFHTASWLALNESTNRLYVVDFNNDIVTLLDAASMSPLRSRALPDGPSATAINHVHDRLYVSSVRDKSLTALDGETLEILSIVKLPLQAFFLSFDATESRIYTSGGDALDESGAMVVTDVLGKLGANVSVVSASNGLGGVTTVNSDYSITYVPNPGFSGTDTFTYTIRNHAGTASGVVHVHVLPAIESPVAMPDAYISAGAVTSVAAPGVLANDVAPQGATLTAGLVSGPSVGTLTFNADGSFDYTSPPEFDGTVTFQYVAIAGGVTSPLATVSITRHVSSFIVTNSNDSGPGSLRAAIAAANATPGFNDIRFAIPGASPASPAIIVVNSPLPAITDSVGISATSQPGYDGLPVIELTAGSPGNPEWAGLQLMADGSVVRGLSITRFGQGIFAFQTHTGHAVEQNFIGTNRSGATDRGNLTGIVWRANGSAIENNVISGNRVEGLVVTNGAAKNVVRANRIGTDKTGLQAVPNGGNGVTLYGGAVDTLIEGNVISANGGWGVEIQDGETLARVTGTRLRGNLIGLRADGTLFGFGDEHISGVTFHGMLVDFGPAERGNRGGGVRVHNAPGTRIGEPGQGNKISGNTGAGVHVTGTVTPAPRIQANLIGLDPTGLHPRGNTTNGVEVVGGGIMVGGKAMEEGNTVSANIVNGVAVRADGVDVVSNRVGTDAAGERVVDSTGVPLGNGVLTNERLGCCHAGILLQASFNFVGQNIVSGNLFGIRSSAPADSSNLIEQNRIGTNAAGTASLPNLIGVNLSGDYGTQVSRNRIVHNLQHGVLIAEGTRRAVIGGGPGLGNTISGNGRGVVVGYDAGSVDDLENEVTFNTISGNEGVGIDLGNDGRTFNDSLDSDRGPNTLQNWPVLDSATHDGTSMSVAGSLHSTPGAGFRIHVYWSPGCTQGGAVFVGEGTVTTDATGDGSFKLSLAPPPARGGFLTATATDDAGNTSEFSSCQSVTEVMTVQGTSGSVEEDGDPPTNTMVVLQPGEPVHIAAGGPGVFNGPPLYGPWSPDGYEEPADSTYLLPGAPRYSLIGRIGKGPWMFVGSNRMISTATGGLLELAVNDSYFGDNSGSWNVWITRSPPMS